MSDPGDQAAGRALIEAGGPVAGTMTGAAAKLVFAQAGAPVQIDPRLSVCLRAAATEAAAVSVPRERVRAGAALAFAVERSVTLAQSGRALRDDEFFAGRAGTRTAAGAVIEAAVAAARRSTDERRVRHLGYLVAVAAFCTDLDADLALRALRLAEPLSWRQLALLAAVGRRERVPLPLTPLPDDNPRAWTAWGAREDLTDLQRTGLLDPPPSAGSPGAVLPRLRAVDLRLTRRAVLVHRLLALDFVRDDDVAEALADLGLPRS